MSHDHGSFIIELFCWVDDHMPSVPKHPQAKLYPSELVTIGVLFALKGGYFRAFYRWLSRDYAPLFAGLPERTRLQRLLLTHQVWCNAFLAAPTFFTVIDSYGIELIHPIREGRRPQQVGKKGKSNWRWIIGMKLCWLLNDRGEVVSWAWLGTLPTFMIKSFCRWSLPLRTKAVCWPIQGSTTLMASPATLRCARAAPGMSGCWSKPPCRW
jgi:hypothetical protein